MPFCVKLNTGVDLFAATLLREKVRNLHKNLSEYMAGHPIYNSIVHVVGGVGVGILIARPYVVHPIRVGLVLLALALLGHIYPLWSRR